MAFEEQSCCSAADAELDMVLEEGALADKLGDGRGNIVVI